MSSNGSTPPFAGFSSPNYTQVPDELFDVLMPDLTEAELRVALYIVRRTFGFKKASDNISLRQIVAGITTKDGTVLDRGAGVGKTAAVRAIKGLVEKGVIVAQRNRSRERGNEPTTFAVRLKDDPLFTKGTRGGSPREQGLVPLVNPQETVGQETERQYSRPRNMSTKDFSDDEGEATTAQPVPDSEPPSPAFRRFKEQALRHRASQDGTGETTGRRRQLEKPPKLPPPTTHDIATPQRPVAEPDRTVRPDAPTPIAKLIPGRRGRPPGSREEREHVAAYLSDFMVQLNDQAGLSSSVTRALNLLKRANVPPERWGDFLYEARSVTQERSAAITTTVHPAGKVFPVKNKAPYYFEILTDLLGLREGTGSPRQPEHALSTR